MFNSCFIWTLSFFPLSLSTHSICVNMWYVFNFIRYHKINVTMSLEIIDSFYIFAAPIKCCIKFLSARLLSITFQKRIRFLKFYIFLNKDRKLNVWQYISCFYLYSNLYWSKLDYVHILKCFYIVGNDDGNNDRIGSKQTQIIVDYDIFYLLRCPVSLH